MIKRETLIGVLLIAELAIVGEAVYAVRGQFGPQTAAAQGAVVSGTRLVEDGAHQHFSLGSRPRLIVDIGYADLTISPSSSSRIDVSLSGSHDGMLGSSAPIGAQATGKTLHLSAASGRQWSMGDDRMVTVLVPPDTRVTVINAGDIKASGLRAGTSIKSVGSGTITVADFSGPSLSVVSSNGLISLHDITTDQLDVASKNDRVDASGLHVANGTVESDERATLGFAAGTDALVTAETGSGHINLSGFDSLATVRTRSSESDSSSATQSVRLGSGSGHLHVHVNDGSIDLIDEASPSK